LRTCRLQTSFRLSHANPQNRYLTNYLVSYGFKNIGESTKIGSRVVPCNGSQPCSLTTTGAESDSYHGLYRQMHSHRQRYQRRSLSPDRLFSLELSTCPASLGQEKSKNTSKGELIPGLLCNDDTHLLPYSHRAVTERLMYTGKEQVRVCSMKRTLVNDLSDKSTASLTNVSDYTSTSAKPICLA